MLSGFEVDNNRGRKIVMFTKTFMGQAGIQNYLLVERGGGGRRDKCDSKGPGWGGGAMLAILRGNLISLNTPGGSPSRFTHVGIVFS